MEFPEDLRYTKEHEWARAEGGRVRIGITDFAQDALGDVVFVELPTVGTQIEAGRAFGVVESNKSVSDLYAPVTARVLAVNPRLREQPELVNQDPYGEGWMVRIALDGDTSAAGLLDAAAYRAHVEAERAK